MIMMMMMMMMMMMKSMMMMMMMMMMQPQNQKKTNAIDCNDDADTDYSGLDKLATRYSCSSVPVTLTDFSKHGQVDFYKAADSISDYLASIFPRLSDLFNLLK